MNIPFIKYRKFYYFFSGVLILGSIFSLVVFGLRPGIDFTGGSILEIEYRAERPSNQEVQGKLADLDLGSIVLQPTGDRALILRMKDIDEETHQAILQRLGQVKEQRFESIGPVIGQELKQKTKFFTVLALLAIVLYLTFAFRKVSRPLSSWQYGLITVFVAFFHNLLIPLGIFSILSQIYPIQITIPIVVGLLTVLGYSINDTIVVFDRVRENLLRGREENFQDTVNSSLNQTLVRSINTSLTALFVLVAIFFFGGETLKYFSLILILGIICGTYSSIFIASPLLVTWFNFKQKKR
ncbi:MAG TPA: protein translocase subunit SecF [Candidatus Nealsonbacteria bacterium]|uniref:Protein translocase subunit SecF n=1 Tax=marine sediment metagenome TaxID=412755 RepID=A0A0F9WN83_9ZZZZ|nr:protein translocase subunit SecF [Candidatus Nealsonbacteria bacterium]HEB46636.1 protein translocase subunit SecF [Candidatus Nealsonbacteria bacterium]